MVQHAARWTEDSVPSVAALAASVILLRDGERGLETYLLHRHARMPFAASMVVFPGGRVDPVDGSGGGDPISRCAIRETVEESGVELSETDLYPWAHWITPEIEQRRYDTWFFVAAIQADQETADISGETNRVEWSTPAEALAAERAGLAEVIDLATDRHIEPVLPAFVETERGWQVRYPQTAPSEDSS
jgi:8-oxo-dGTP pyrophosphatase MutT (NUDIX family)